MEGLSKTPDEIKMGLKFAESNCLYVECCEDICPYNKDCDVSDPDRMAEMPRIIATDALAYIQQLEADNAQLNRCVENMTDKLNAAHDETVELKRERDALVEIIRNEANFNPVPLQCRCCKNFNGDFTKDTCRFCGTKAPFGNFEWRGVKEDNQ